MLKAKNDQIKTSLNTRKGSCFGKKTLDVIAVDVCRAAHWLLGVLAAWQNSQGFTTTLEPDRKQGRVDRK